MKVLHILWSGDIGGAQRAVYQLVKGQTEATNLDIQPAVIFGKSDGLYYEKIKEIGCEVIDANLQKEGNIFKLFKTIKLMKPFDIHHFHSAELLFGLASLFCNVRRVYTHRGGICSYHLKQLFRYKLFGLLLKCYFSRLSGNTRHACKSAALLFKIPENLWEVIYNGLDFQLLVPERTLQEVRKQLGLINYTFIIVTAAQIRKWKRIDLLLDAYVALKNLNIMIIIIGDGPERGNLETLANKLGIRNNTIFVGKQDNIADFLQLADVFVLPSSPLESFGNACVEAMAMGIPVIVMSDGGGLTEHVIDGRNGFIVTSVDEMATKLKELYHYSDLRKAMGNEAKRYVTQKYTITNMIKDYQEFYRSVL
ncbi:MAG: glycosyltransferase family 4 protein [Ignavibacteria bacterium]